MHKLSPLVPLCAMALMSGCAGAWGEYGPGNTGVFRTGTGTVRTGMGSGTMTRHSYTVGQIGYGIQLGARVGFMHAQAKGARSGNGLAVDAHTDVTISHGRFGGGLSVGYTSDRIIGGDTWAFSGFPLGVYGQVLLTDRLSVHAGGSYVLGAAIKHIEVDQSGGTSAARGSAGLDVVLSRSSANDWVFRVEGRYTKAGTADVAGMKVDWTSTAVLGELLWATF
jgi:hypothetical protein